MLAMAACARIPVFLSGFAMSYEVLNGGNWWISVMDMCTSPLLCSTNIIFEFSNMCHRKEAKTPSTTVSAYA